jgi:hypothetical protein
MVCASLPKLNVEVVQGVVKGGFPPVLMVIMFGEESVHDGDNVVR